jgi:hypothetical protein
MTTRIQPTPTGYEAITRVTDMIVMTSSDRNDLITRSYPDAPLLQVGSSAPGVYVPSSRIVCVDTNTIGVTPDTLDTNDSQHTKMLAAYVGVTIHEAGHAAHTNLDIINAMPNRVRSAAVLLEEIRMEAAQIRRRPQDQPHLRSSAHTLILDEINKNASAEPDSKTRLIHNAVLILGRCHAKTLTTRDTSKLRAATLLVLGQATLDTLDEILKQTTSLIDTDSVGFEDAATRLTSLFDENKEDDQSEENSEGGEGQGEPDAITTEQIRQLIEEALEELEEQTSTDTDTGAATKELLNAIKEAILQAGTSTERVELDTRRPNAPEQNASRQLARRLERVVALSSKKTRTPKLVPPGRLHTRRLINHQAQVAANKTPDEKIFTQKLVNQKTPADWSISLMLDTSGSMTDDINTATSALWVVKNAFEELGGTVNLWTFGQTHQRITTRRNEVPIISAGGGTQHLDKCISEANQEPTSRHTLRHLIVISDGCWCDPHNVNYQLDAWHKTRNSTSSLITLGYAAETDAFTHTSLVVNIQQLDTQLGATLSRILNQPTTRFSNRIEQK